MSEFGKKILNEYIIPSKDKSRIGTLIATIVTVKKKRYDIELNDENGNKKIVENVIIRSDTLTSGAYALEVEDEVLVEMENNIYYIIGKVQNNDDKKLKNDIYTDLIYDIIPGSIY